MSATYAETIHDLEVQIGRHKDEMRLKDKDVNDALLKVEEFAKETEAAKAAEAEAKQKGDAASEQARQANAALEAANTEAAAAKDKAAKSEAAAKDAAENLAAERALRKQLEEQNAAKDKVIAALQAQVDEARPKLDAIAALGL